MDIQANKEEIIKNKKNKQVAFLKKRSWKAATQLKSQFQMKMGSWFTEMRSYLQSSHN